VSYTVPKQSAATGPTDTDWDLGQGHSIIQLNLRDVNQGYYHQVNIRAWRDVGCAKAPMNSAVSCGQNQSSLVLKFMSEDNESLPAGHYQGVFTVSAQGWNDKAYTNTLTRISGLLMRKRLILSLNIQITSADMLIKRVIL
jgi:hypothetical protein